MNRLQYILTAKTQYDIQSPFLYELYSRVLNTRISKNECARLGLSGNDRYSLLCYKLMDYYEALPAVRPELDVDDFLMSNKVGGIALLRSPHKDRQSEARWAAIIQNEEVTLSVDLFDVGIVFFNKNLSRQCVVLRCL